MPDMSHERARLYKLVDKWIEEQAAIEYDEDCEGCQKLVPQDARVASAALVVGVNYELPDFDPDPTTTYQAIFSHAEAKDGWAKAGLLQGAADIVRAEMNPMLNHHSH